MDVLVEGNITDEVDMGNLLQALQEHSASQLVLLRITSTPLNVNGKLAVSKGFIVGAKEAGGEERYGAIRKLLAVRNGSFAMLASDVQAFERANQRIFVKIDRILQHIAQIEQLSDGIFDRWNQTDKEMFYPHARDVGEPVLIPHAGDPIGRRRRFNRFMSWERTSERFLGAFYWLVFAVIVAGAVFYLRNPAVIHR